MKTSRPAVPVSQRNARQHSAGNGNINRPLTMMPAAPAILVRTPNGQLDRRRLTAGTRVVLLRAV
jgi:hypothetical protein